MPNIASVLKSEIARVARKEVRAEISSLKKAASVYRSDIADLKRRAHSLELEVRQLRKATAGAARQPEPTQASPRELRFSAKGLASQRQRLELSAEELGRLIGTTSQSIYNWESGKTRPRAKYLPAIAALKTLAKKAAAAHLESLA